MASATACIGLNLEDIAPACGITDSGAVPEQTAFQQLQQCLQKLREGDQLPLQLGACKTLYAAVAASRVIPWPGAKLLRDTLLILSRATDGPSTPYLVTSVKRIEVVLASCP